MARQGTSAVDCRRAAADRHMKIGRAQLASLAIVWKHPHVSRLGVRVNPNLRSTVARWMPSNNVLEISATAKSKSKRAFQEVICHEAAHMVVWDRAGRRTRPHGPEWAALMRAAGFEPRATLVRCGRRRGSSNTRRIRHFCPVCHFSKIAKRRMPRWRCPECQAIGLEGKLKMSRVSRQ
jgi:SprT protein